jgi:hypothetical protein
MYALIYPGSRPQSLVSNGRPRRQGTPAGFRLLGCFCPLALLDRRRVTWTWWKGAICLHDEVRNTVLDAWELWKSLISEQRLLVFLEIYYCFLISWRWYQPKACWELSVSWNHPMSRSVIQGGTMTWAQYRCWRPPTRSRIWCFIVRQKTTGNSQSVLQRKLCIVVNNDHLSRSNFVSF